LAFVRWQRRKRLRGDVRWDSVLVESVRVDGQPRQKVIGCIAGFREADFDKRNGAGGAVVARAFWRRASARLRVFKLTKAQHAAAMATLAAKVPEMNEQKIGPK
jgi:hypothetical protein